MVNVKVDNPQQQAPQANTLASRVKSGKILPIISGEALEDLVIGDHLALARFYAGEIKSPFQDFAELHKIAKEYGLRRQYKVETVKSEFLDSVARCLLQMARDAKVPEKTIRNAEQQAAGLSVSEFAGRLGFPNFDPKTFDPLHDPLQILANLPISVFITTSPYTFVEAALVNANKTPETEFCRWHPGLDQYPSVLTRPKQGESYEPSNDRPLVYHLFGVDKYPDSLILTEDDFLDFLMAVSQGRGQNAGVDPIPSVVKGALNSKALLFIGFSLSSWSFRSLYRGLIKPIPNSDTYQRYCCLQLVPNVDEKNYFDRYLQQDARIDEIFWKDVRTFCEEHLLPA